MGQSPTLNAGRCFLIWKPCKDQNRLNEKPPEISTISRGMTWQGQKDSNPQQRFWRPTCYHYTMPLRQQRYYSQARSECQAKNRPNSPDFGPNLRFVSHIAQLMEAGKSCEAIIEGCFYMNISLIDSAFKPQTLYLHISCFLVYNGLYPAGKVFSH